MTTKTLAGRRVVVTGGAGFIGSAVCRAIAAAGAAFVGTPRSRELDLCDRAATARMFATLRPDIVVHAAGVGGGIAAHLAHPGLHFYANSIMALRVIEEARRSSIERLVFVEVSIAELAQTIAMLCGFRGRIAWDKTKPDGHARRVLDVSRAHVLLDFRARTPLADGLARTVDWWRSAERTSNG